MKKLSILLLFIILNLQGYCRYDFIRITDDTSKKYSYVEDDPIIAMLDSLAVSKLFDCQSSFNDQLVDHYSFGESNFQLNDSILIERFKRMADKSPFPYVYNEHVKNYIEYYAIKKRGTVPRMLGLAQLYFPMFEEILDKYQLPLELKYLAIVESALNPFAVSRAKAMGIWQFMYKTARIYNLNITSYIDERLDPVKQTVAACEYLQDLYNLYGDWNLVLAAYNAGPGNVNKAIRRAGGKISFWEIYPYLPRETRNYVPAFNAVSYIMTYAKQHDLHPIKPRITYFHLDTVMVSQSVTFKQISAVINVPEEDLKFLNPAYKKGYIPAYFEPMPLVLPNQYVAAFINNQTAIYNYKTLEDFDRQQQLLAKLKISPEELEKAKNIQTASLVENSSPENNDTADSEDVEEETIQVKKFYKVKKGEHLSAISKKLSCSINDLKKWNNLKSNNIAVGKVLVYYVTEKVEKPKPQPKEEKTTGDNNNNVKTKYYTIQKGDTLWNIATRNGITVENLKQLNNINDNFILKVGEKLKVPVKG